MLKIPENIIEKIIDQGLKDAPLEICGILAGSDGRVEKIYTMINADNSSDHFMMLPEQQFKVIKDIRSRGMKMLAIYHTHPQTPARPSQEDMRLALTEDVVYVITSLNSAIPVTKCFLIKNGITEEIELEIEYPFLRIPKNAREDTANFRSRLDQYLNGKTSDVAFRAYRVPMGIYEQRIVGNFMARVRVGAGIIKPYQLYKITELSKKYGNGIVHVTTRQDLQIHDLKIADTADVLEQLLEVGLSTRGGGGNTVRNVSACPRSGVCPNEIFDVSPYAIAVTEYLLQSSDSFNLPRKFKLAFSGCCKDCSLASIADIGFFAHVKNGKKGFAVYGAGGLGSSPKVAIKLEDFIEAGEIFEAAQTIKEIFDKFGDRTDKHKARLRYVLNRLGENEFKRLYQQTRQRIKQQGLNEDVPEIRDITHELVQTEKSIGFYNVPDILSEKNKGFYSIELHLRFGDIPANDLIKVADIAEKYSKGCLRTTQLQNMMITSVPVSNVTAVLEELDNLSIDVFGKSKANIVTCTGADTCKLGLCLSKGLAKAISDEFEDITGNKPLVRISGCPNSCGHHCIAEIGFQGKAKRINGKLMPCYDVFTGARIAEGNSKLAIKIGTLPAKDIPHFLKELYLQHHAEVEKLIGKYGDFSREFPEDYFYDFSADQPFSLKGRGLGECGAGVMDMIKVDIDTAKQTWQNGQRGGNDSIYSAITSAARALLVIFGHEPQTDQETFTLFERELIDAGWVSCKIRDLLDAAVKYKNGNLRILDDKKTDAKNLIDRVEKLYLSLDSGLKFNIEPFGSKQYKRPVTNENLSVDLRGVACPLNFVKAKLFLEKIAIGNVLEILIDDGEAVKNVPASFTEQGQVILDIENFGTYHRIKVLKGK